MMEQGDKKSGDKCGTSCEEKRKPCVLITGITGQQGSGVADHLYFTHKYHIRGLVRDLKDAKAAKCLKDYPNIELVEGDLNIPTSLTKAVCGCDFAYLVTDYTDTFDEEKETTAGRNFLNACKESGVKHVILSSLPSSSMSSGLLTKGIKVPHFDSKAAIENYLRSLGLRHTILHFGFYFENFLTIFKPMKDPRDGKWKLTFPMADKPLGGVAVKDGGALVAMVLENPDFFQEKVISVCSEVLRGEEYARILTKNLGQTIEYEPMSVDEFSKLSFPGAPDYAAMFNLYQQYGSKIWHPAETQKMLKLQTFDDWCRQHVRGWNLV
jgi:uncharacterized protein YbjT (DUF2867 family)